MKKELPKPSGKKSTYKNIPNLKVAQTKKTAT